MRSRVASSAGGSEKRPFFYGWVVVAASFFILLVAYGLQFSYGVFVSSISDELGWSRSQTALPYSIYVLFYSVLSSPTGAATDRFGPRPVVSIGALMLGLGWALSSFVEEPWHLMVTLGVVAAVGMSVTWAPCNGTVVKWFTRLRGTAVAVTTVGGSVGNLIVPTVAAGLVSTYGWRPTLRALAALATILIVVSAQFLVRDPESRGLHPDGDVEPTETEVGSTAFDIRWSRPFLLIVGAYGLTWLAVFIPFVHGAALAEDLGISPVRAATVISAMGIGGIIGRLLAGPLSDIAGRFPTLIAMFLLEVAAFAIFAFAGSIEALWAGAVLFGFSYGGGVVLFPPLCGDIWGRTHAASIVGAAFARAGGTAAIGPWLAGWLHDVTGDYQLAFLFGSAANLLGLGFVVALAINQSGLRGSGQPA